MHMQNQHRQGFAVLLLYKRYLKKEMRTTLREEARKMRCDIYNVRGCDAVLCNVVYVLAYDSIKVFLCVLVSSTQ